MKLAMWTPPWPMVDRLEAAAVLEDWDTLKTLADEVLAEAGGMDGVRGHEVYGWGTDHYTPGIWTVHPVHAGSLYRPIALLGGEYREAALLAADDHAVDIDWDRGCYTPPDGAGAISGRNYAQGDVLPVNMQAAMGRLHLALGEKDIASMLVQHVRGALGGVDHWVWSYVDGGRPEDTWHGSMVARFVLECYEAEIVSSEHVERMVQTFLWLAEDPAQCRSHLSESYGVRGGDRAQQGALMWGELARFDSRVGAVLGQIEGGETALGRAIVVKYGAGSG